MSKRSHNLSLDVPPAWKSPLLSAALMQGVVLVVGMLLLDGGTMLKLWLLASAAFWMLIATLARLHPASPTMLDRCLAVIALPMLVLAATIVADAV